jgi:hypothetical protein
LGLPRVEYKRDETVVIAKTKKPVRHGDAM